MQREKFVANMYKQKMIRVRQIKKEMFGWDKIWKEKYVASVYKQEIIRVRKMQREKYVANIYKLKIIQVSKTRKENICCKYVQTKNINNYNVFTDFQSCF